MLYDQVDENRSRVFFVCGQDDVSFVRPDVYFEYPPYPLGISSAHPSGLWCQLTTFRLPL
jgi:hypothetical protein